MCASACGGTRQPGPVWTRRHLWTQRPLVPRRLAAHLRGCTPAGRDVCAACWCHEAILLHALRAGAMQRPGSSHVQPICRFTFGAAAVHACCRYCLPDCRACGERPVGLWHTSWPVQREPVALAALHILLCRSAGLEDGLWSPWIEQVCGRSHSMHGPLTPGEPGMRHVTLCQ